MRQIYQQPEPPKQSSNIRDIILVLATVIGTVIGSLILGTTHIIGFNSLVLILVAIMFGIMLFCVWFTFRTRQSLQEKYQQDLSTLKREYRAAQDNYRDMINQESNRLNEWAASFSQASDKEHRERTEELKRQCMEAIHDAEQRLDVNMKNSMSLYKTAQETAGIIIDQYRNQLIVVQRKLDAIEEHFKNMTLPTDQE